MTDYIDENEQMYWDRLLDNVWVLFNPHNLEGGNVSNEKKYQDCVRWLQFYNAEMERIKDRFYYN